MEIKNDTNITLRMGEKERGICFKFYLKKTFLNRIKMSIFCFFVPFVVDLWTN